MTTRENPLKVPTAPVIGVVLDAPSVLKASEHSSFQTQVEKRFRLVPNFFVSAPDAPEIVERLWSFAAAAYLDNPIPTQRAAFCLPLAFLSGPLLHCAPLRISCGLWSCSGRPGGSGADH